MSPNLYDLLNIDEDATADEIRAAWKAAIADLDPTDRRFRAFNDAAEVLLDPVKRAEYDAGLAESRAAEEEAEAQNAAPDTEPAPAEDEPAPETSAGAARPGPSTRTLVGVGVAAALSVALLVWLFTLPGTTAEPTPAERQDQTALINETSDSAEDAATRIAASVLAYDYRTFDDAIEQAQSVSTPEFGEEQANLLEDLRQQAVKQKVVVTASVDGTAVTRVSDDGDQASVVVFVDQSIRRAGEEPPLLRMWVTMALVRDGDTWLLDDLCTVGGNCG